MSQEYDFSKGKRGAVAPPSTGKSRITIRLDDEVLRWFRAQVHRAGGGNYQSLINLALRAHINRSSDSLEQTLRRILREELHSSPDRTTAKRKNSLRKKLSPGSGRLDSA